MLLIDVLRNDDYANKFYVNSLQLILKLVKKRAYSNMKILILNSFRFKKYEFLLYLILIEFIRWRVPSIFLIM